MIRVSEICEQSESKGTRKITAPKLTKLEQLQKSVNKLEAQKIMIEKQRNDLLAEIQKSNPTINTVTDHSLDKMYFAVMELLERDKFLLEKELKGYKTITCRKGSEVLSITDAKPKCPKGYK